jgi:tellurite resistance protein
MAVMKTRLGTVISGVPGWRRFPPNLFGIPFGLAGLVEAWDAAGPTLHTPAAVPDALSVVAALAWVTLLACYCAQGTRSIIADFRNKTLSPFIALAPITGMLLATTLSAHAFAAGQALVVVFLIATLVLGGLLTGEWIVASLDHDSAHPGYFLPTVAGGLVGAFCAAEVHLHGLATASFGIGMLSWLLIGSTILNRLFFHSSLPPALVPTLAIELAPPAVAGIAYFALTGGRIGFPAQALAGYVVLMVLVQVRLLPSFGALRFAPGFWAFTFSWAAVATDALEWIAARKPPGAAGYAAVILAVITAFVGYIAARTVVLIAGGQLLPPRVPPEKIKAEIIPNERADPSLGSLNGPSGTLAAERVAQRGTRADAELGKDPVQVSADRAG